MNPSGAIASERVAQLIAMAENAAGTQQPETTVLLIEDNVGFAFYLRDALVKKHPGLFNLLEVTYLDAGLEILGDRQVDVILLDLGLPDSGGFSTFARARAAAPGTPVIVLTALHDEDMAMKAMRHGAQDYLLKDVVDHDVLVRSIRYAIERGCVENKVRQLTGRLLRSQDEERRRIARELHDSTAQTLAALSLNLTLLNSTLSSETQAVRDLVLECLACAEQCSSELRTMSYLLHPPLLDELGLAGAVRDYVDGFAERSKIRMDLEISPQHLGRMPKDAETALFRIMQESLTNIHRHSGSATASVQLSRTPLGVRLEVADRGTGFPRDRMPAMQELTSAVGVGIAGMRERVNQLGGRLDIQTGPGGTTITASLPLEADEAASQAGEG